MARVLPALILTFLSASAYAQTGQASYGQYLVVLDDSGSMDRSDPSRLVVMASMALAAVLEDGDQVMLVGLNELASGDIAGPAFRSPRELLPGRDGAAERQTLGGERPERIGTHDGGTPCGPALERARAILNAVANSGAPQTLLMLTDGACNGGTLPPTRSFLDDVSAHADGRFRFVLLTRAGPGRPTRRLVEYAEATGWTSDPRVAFDARALTRAFADVLSFSRGLRYDDGGRIGLERTFAGARAVRVLGIRTAGDAAIALERVSGGESARIDGGPTFVSAHGWSFRVAQLESADAPFAVRSATEGTEVLIVPVYGRLRIEAVVAPCGTAPPLPWTEERAVRAGQPACAWARLVGDRAETIVPGRSFEFRMETCEDDECASASAMQPGEDGSFHAQLGDLPAGRHTRTFRATDGALAEPVMEHRGFASVTFGVHRVTQRSDGSRVEVLDLGTLPVAAPEGIALVVEGSFPAESRARASCVVTTPGGVSECFRCAIDGEELALQDRLTLQLDARATTFCDAASAHGGRLPLAAEIRLEPVGAAANQLSPFVLPIRAQLVYAELRPAAIEVEGGSEASARLTVPGPAALQDVTGRVELDGPDVSPEVHAGPLRANAEGLAEIELHVAADECCSPGRYEGLLILSADGSEEHVPLVVTVTDPSFWVCPGRRILRWSLAVLGVLLLIWILRGIFGPARFRKGATLLYADSHDALLALREGDDGWRPLERFVQTKRRFRRAGTVFLGGPHAPLPSLRRMPPDGRIEARPGGGATLLVEGPGVERFTETGGWQELAPGTYPVPNKVLLKRADLYLEFRR